uniref:Uncharacterized protein n=1 Tax=Romanomermis culicivorax TaxID=13658 RepID=A0A915K2Q9_ROMCU
MLKRDCLRKVVGRERFVLQRLEPWQKAGQTFHQWRHGQGQLGARHRGAGRDPRYLFNFFCKASELAQGAPKRLVDIPNLCLD